MPPAGACGAGLSRARPALVAAVAALLACGAAANGSAAKPTASYGANEPEAYAVNFDDVSTTSTETSRTVTTLGDCACDLTLNLCDANCQCDADCTSEEKEATFTGSLPEGPDPPELEFCVSDSSVATVNLPSSGSLAVVKKAEADDGFLSEMLCISTDNNGEYGKFFADPVDGTSALLDDAITDETFYWWDKADADVATSSSASYMVNMSIGAVYLPAGSATTVATEGGVFALPAAAFSDACDRLETVGFMYDVPFAPFESDIACTQYVSDLSAQCADLGADRLVNYLQIASTASTSPSYLEVSVTELKYRFSDAASAGTLVNDTLASTLPATRVVPSASYSSSTCEYALASVDYTITHSGSGTITAVEASVVVTDVAAGATGAASLRQRFSVTFVTEASYATARPKSGAPGYAHGAPLLAGTRLADSASGSDKVAVSRLTEGLPVVSAGASGACQLNARTPVRFGRNQVSTCTVPLTKTGLQAFCEGSGTYAFDAYVSAVAASTAATDAAPTSSPPLAIQLLDGLLYSTAGGGSFATNRTYVGGWADTDATNIADWMEVSLLDAPSTAASWDSSTRTCSNVAAGIKYEFLTAVVGSLGNPQHKVSFARLSYVYEDWTFSDPLAAASTTQDFALKSTVQWAPQEQDSAEGVSPEKPPLFPALPSDFFYPFT